MKDYSGNANTLMLLLGVICLTSLIGLFTIAQPDTFHIDYRMSLSKFSFKNSLRAVYDFKDKINPIPNSPQNSKYAYTTLISGIDKSLRYRGFLYNALIMHQSLKRLGSTADFVAMVGLNSAEDENVFVEDLNLLKANGIIVHILKRVLNESTLSFAEMALLKVTPWNFTQYEKIQFFDGDVMPTRNMDCFFELQSNTFTVGAVSPLNSGWYLAIPNTKDYLTLMQQVNRRLRMDWNSEIGWSLRIPTASAAEKLHVRGGHKFVSKWDFNGADMDQGLLTHHFILTKGGGVLIDTVTDTVRIYNNAGDKSSPVTTNAGVAPYAIIITPEKSTTRSYLAVCRIGVPPTGYFIHFTGKSKPWLNIPTPSEALEFVITNPGVLRKDQPLALLANVSSTPVAGGIVAKRDVMIWLQHLDELKLQNGVDSSNIGSLGLNSPLGYFNANFRKGDT